MSAVQLFAEGLGCQPRGALVERLFIPQAGTGPQPGSNHRSPLRSNVGARNVERSFNRSARTAHQRRKTCATVVSQTATASARRPAAACLFTPEPPWRSQADPPPVGPRPRMEKHLLPKTI